jgi:hypothetical protein
MAMDRLSVFIKSKPKKLFTIKNNFQTSYPRLKYFNTISENFRGLANP